MKALLDFASNASLVTGAAFFLAGTIGLLRFPDVYCRLHALAKVDNLGLGFTVIGLMLRSADVAQAAKLLLVWVLALIASATVSFLIAHRAYRRGITCWQTPEHGP